MVEDAKRYGSEQASLVRILYGLSLELILITNTKNRKSQNVYGEHKRSFAFNGSLCFVPLLFVFCEIPVTSCCVGAMLVLKPVYIYIYIIWRKAKMNQKSAGTENIFSY